MKGLLVRIGIDHSYGHWNAPVDPISRLFVYVPIPEAPSVEFHPGLERSYQEILPPLLQFCTSVKRDLISDLKFPSSKLFDRFIHLDPDFGELTYGDIAKRRGRDIAKLSSGDLLAFYSGLRSIYGINDSLIYALVGLYIVEEIVPAYDIPTNRWNENAHTRRRMIIGASDVVVRAKKMKSGRLEKCIPIGEWRDRAYRVKKELLKEWGGLSVKDGYIQRSAVPPSFLNPAKFYQWFLSQEIKLIQENN